MIVFHFPLLSIYGVIRAPKSEGLNALSDAGETPKARKFSGEDAGPFGCNVGDCNAGGCSIGTCSAED
jgi:hypothetical protein